MTGICEGCAAEREAVERLRAERNRLVESCREAERERDALRSQLCDLLAVIHRDGGHYTAEHGIDRSVRDARAVVAETRIGLVEALDRWQLLSETVDGRGRCPDVECDKLHHHADDCRYAALRKLAGSPLPDTGNTDAGDNDE